MTNSSPKYAGASGWISASDYRHMDYQAYSLASKVYESGYLDSICKHLKDQLDPNLAKSESILVCADKIKDLLLVDCCTSLKHNRTSRIVKARLSYRIKRAIKKMNLHDFRQHSTTVEIKLLPVLLFAFGVIFNLKALFFYLNHSGGILFKRTVRNTTNKKVRVLLGDDSLLSGVGKSYAKALTLLDPLDTVIFSPEEKLEKKTEFLNKNFSAYDASDLRKMIPMSKYAKSIKKDWTLFVNTIWAIWAFPEFSSEIYKLMIRTMTWRMFDVLFSYSTVIKFMVRPSRVDRHYSRLGNAKLCFAYFSITPNPIPPLDGKDIYGNLDYVDMDVDYLLCDSISNAMFSALNNRYHHVVVSPYQPSLIITPEIGNIPKIVFMDNTWGFAGVNSLDAMLLFFETIMHIWCSGDFDVRVKLKKNDINFYRSRLRNERTDLFERFESIVVQIQALIIGNASSIECIQSADLVVSSPLSSVIYEAISYGSKVLVYDPLAECANNLPFRTPLGDIYCGTAVTLANSIRVSLASESFYDYLLLNDVKLNEFDEFKAASKDSPMLFENAINFLSS
jgi:hypothetical protein